MGRYGHRRLRTIVATVASGGTLAVTALVTAVPAHAGSLAALPDTFSVDATSHVATGNVLDNDTGSDGAGASAATTTLVSVTDPAKGTVSFQPEGTVTYTPEACASGDFTVDYTIADLTDATQTTSSTVTFRVDEANTPLHANPDTVQATGGKASGNVLTNDCGATVPVNPADVTLSVVSQPAHGTVTLNDDGTFQYTAQAGDRDADAFDYKIANANGLESTATVTIEPGRVDLAVAITDPEGIDLGVAGTTAVTVTNKGSETPADPTVLTFTVPDFVLIDSAPDNCEPNEDGSVATCPLTVADLAPGKSVTLSFDVEVDEDTPVNTVVHGLTATVETPGDADESNNTARTADLGKVVGDELVPPSPSPTAPKPQGKNELANTGVNYVGQMTAAGVVLVLAGVGVVLFTRRRRTSD